MPRLPARRRQTFEPGFHLFCGDSAAERSGPFDSAEEADWHRSLYDACEPWCAPHEVAALFDDRDVEP